MTQPSLQGRLALVTGASSGLGVDFARELARRGCDLVLVARRLERLQAVAQEIRDQHGVRVDVVACDLAEAGAPQQLYDQLKAAGRAVDLLVNNAGFGLYGLTWEIPWEQERQMLAVDVMALAHLTRLFLDDMLARDSGYILQVASYGAYTPAPTYASYSAAKAFVLSYGEALSYELRRRNVHVTVATPGVVRTEFHQVAGQELNLYQRLTIADSASVARASIRALLRGKPTVAPGWLTQMTIWTLKFLPRRWQAALAYMTMTMS